MHNPATARPVPPRPELSYDSRGINGPDEYRTRLCTFDLQRWDAATVDKYGRLFEAAPEMLGALKQIPRLIRLTRDHIARGNSQEELELVGMMTAHAVEIENLIAKAGGKP